MSLPSFPLSTGARRKGLFGFTLIELLVVVVVIGILSGIALVLYGNQKEKAYQASMLNDVRNFAVMEETHAADGGYLAPEALPGFRYSKNDTTLGYSTAGNSWALLVTNHNSKTVCGAQGTSGASIKPVCGIPTANGIVASTTSPSSGQTVTYDITAFLAQVAIATPATNGGLFSPTTMLAASDYANATLIGWDFGDSTGVSGPPATTAVVTHTYAHSGNYTVKVGVLGASGVTYSANIAANVSSGGSGSGGSGPAPNVTPVAAFTVSSNPVVVGTVTSFDASSSSDSDGSVASYAWAFGDGATGAGVSASHSYAVTGSYTVTLTVTDNQGATNALQHSVTVTPDNSYVPAASFTISPNAGIGAGSTISFAAPFDSHVTSYAWDFGDSQTAVGDTATHVYSAAGSYSVQLTETASDGRTAVATQSVTVAPPAVATLTMTGGFSATSTVTGRTNTFAATSSIDSALVAYSWDFGDGALASTQSPAHTFAVAQGYAVTLRATTASGNSAVGTLDVVASTNQAPTSTFATSMSSSDSIAAGGVLTASASSTDLETPAASLQYQWVDDSVPGTYSTDGGFTKSNVVAGHHTLQLKTKDQDGAVTTSAVTSYTAATPAPATLMAALAGYTTGLVAAYDPSDLTKGSRVLADEQQWGNNCSIDPAPAAVRSAAPSTGVLTFGTPSNNPAGGAYSCGSSNVGIGSTATVIGVFNTPNTVGTGLFHIDPVYSGVALDAFVLNSTLIDVGNFGRVSTTFPLSQWTSVAITLTSGSKPNVYINGSAFTAAYSNTYVGGGQMLIGSGGGHYFTGQIGVVLRYNVALTQTQINAIRAAIKSYAVGKGFAYASMP